MRLWPKGFFGRSKNLTKCRQRQGQGPLFAVLTPNELGEQYWFLQPHPHLNMQLERAAVTSHGHMRSIFCLLQLPDLTDTTVCLFSFFFCLQTPFMFILSFGLFFHLRGSYHHCPSLRETIKHWCYIFRIFVKQN